MVLRVLDPLAEINKPADRKVFRSVESLHGKRIGLLWGRHAASVKFWPVFRGSGPQEVCRRGRASLQEQQLEPGAAAGRGGALAEDRLRPHRRGCLRVVHISYRA